MQKRSFVKKGDGIVIIAVLLLAVLLLLFGKILYPAVKNGVVEITLDGTLYGRYLLSEDRTLTVVGENGGENTVCIKNGKVYVADATCPDRLCEKQGKISRRGETVVCLPNGLVVMVRDGKENDVDFVVR